MSNHGGKRQGAGRKAGSGKYGEATVAMRVPTSMAEDIRKFVRVKKIERTKIPLYLSSVPAGQPSILEDNVDDFIDLNDFLIRDTEATFIVKADGDSMLGANIKSGDVLIVDRSIEPRHGHIVIACVDNNLTVKRLLNDGNGVSLKPENDDYDVITLKESNELFIWGVVTHVIHKSI